MEYGVKLEVFEGPLDLLLHLIQKNDLDIYDIPISKITSDYLAYLELMKQLNLEVAGEFLVMAATLMRIKSKMLLPVTETDKDDEELVDPRDELVKRLLEYKKFKAASTKLRTSLDAQKDIFYRKVKPEFTEDDFGLEVTLFDLLDAFRNVLEKAQTVSKEIIKEEYTIEEKIRVILSFLEGKRFVSFYTIFSETETRLSVIVTFLALLELIKIGQVYVRQNQMFSEIRIYRRTQMSADMNADVRR
ncbi:MAG: segregation/condensation protein A [Elusimicrobiota bacterium]